MRTNENDIFEAIYRAGEEEGLRSYKKEMRAKIEQAIAEEEEERHLFTLQRGFGFILLMCAFFLGTFLSEWFVALVIAPLAAIMLLSNSLIITRPESDDYDA